MKPTSSLLMLIGGLLWITPAIDAMASQQTMIKNKQTISFKQQINKTTGEHVVHAYLDSLVHIGVARYTNNMINNLFVMEPYASHNNGIIKQMLLRACFSRMRAQGHDSAFVYADRDATWHHRTFNAQFTPASTIHGNPFRLSEKDDLSGCMMIDLTTL